MWIPTDFSAVIQHKTQQCLDDNMTQLFIAGVKSFIGSVTQITKFPINYYTGSGLHQSPSFEI